MIERTEKLLDPVGNVSRRELIRRCGSFALVGALSAAAVAADTTGQSGLSGIGHGVSIHSSFHPKFDARLDQLFPGLRSQPEFRSIAPLAFLITHTDGPPVRAYSATWSMITPAGPQSTTMFFYVRQNPKSALSASRPMLRKGATRLVSPFFNWRPQKLRKTPVPDWEAIFDQNELRSFFIYQVRQASSVQVQLDAVIFTDWTMLGPDQANLDNHLKIRRNAEHDEAVSILRMVRSGASRRMVRAALRQHASIPGVAGLDADVSRSDPKKYLYYHIRTLQAGNLLHHLRTGKGGTFKSLLTRISKTPKTRINVLAS